MLFQLEFKRKLEHKMFIKFLKGRDLQIEQFQLNEEIVPNYDIELSPICYFIQQGDLGRGADEILDRYRRTVLVV